MYDLIIRNAFICDGSGRPGYPGSLAVRDGRIAALGEFDGAAREVIDARGQVLAPGFIDPHTHYDAQLCWDGHATPSLEHGITTVIPGNCSLSLAPVRAVHREFMAAAFRQIEEMPPQAFDAGLQWNWETFEEYVAAIGANLGINVAPLVGHSCLRLWVMGFEARERAATADETTQMQALLRQCLEAGAIGLSTSWVDIDHEFRPVPSRHATLEELDALCAVLGERGQVLQVVPEFWDVDLLCARIDILAGLSLRHGIVCTFSPLFESAATPALTTQALQRVRLHVARGARLVPQMQTRAMDIAFTLDEFSVIFAMRPNWWGVLNAPHAQRLAMLRDPAQRQRLENDLRRPADPIALKLDLPQFTIAAVALEKNRALVGRTLAELAAARGGDAASAMLDLALEEDLQTRFRAVACGHSDEPKIAGFLKDPLVQVGAGDGGAHVMRFATYGDTGYLFSCYVRKHRALSLEQAVHKLTWDIARTWGIADRGLLAPGYAADLVIFDPAHIGRGPEIMVEDLPAAGFRYVRRATGIDSVFVNGRQAYHAGSGYTPERAGRFLARAA